MKLPNTKKAQTSQPKPETPRKPTITQAPVRSSGLLITLIIALVLLGLNLVAGLLLTSSSKERKVAISHLEALRRNQQNLQKLESDLLNYRDKISQLNGILPKEKDIPDFIQFVTDSAEKTGSSVSLNFASNQPSKTKSGLSVIPLNLQLTTTTENLSFFLQTLHQGKYQMRFEHIETNSSPKSPDRLQARLSGKLYVDSNFAAPE